MRRLFISGLLLVVGACGCDSQDNGNQSVTANSARQSDAVVRFVAFGDAGTGSERQIAVGHAMADVCAARGCDFAIELGDNFYASGVQSVDDEQFQSKFEIPYERLNVPVYVTLGNHDNSQGPGEGSDNTRGNYQVEYHYLAGRSSEKFRMPARYYSFTAPAGSETPLVEFFSLDSNPLTAIVSDPDPDWNPESYGAEQLSWFTDALKNSKAPWKIAFAHHPYVSNGLHGNAGNYDGAPATPVLTTSGQPWKAFLEASLCAEGADLYLQGHDHDLEWLKPVEACGNTHFVVSGAAEGPRPFGDPNRNPVYWQKDNTLGFFWIEISRDAMTGAAYVLDGMELPMAGGRPVAAFEQTVTKPGAQD